MQGPPPATTRGRADWGLQWVLTFCVFYSVVAYYLSAAASNRYIVFQKYAFHFLSRYLLSYHIYHMYVYLLCRWRYLSKYLVINYDWSKPDIFTPPSYQAKPKQSVEAKQFYCTVRVLMFLLVLVSSCVCFRYLPAPQCSKEWRSWSRSRRLCPPPPWPDSTPPPRSHPASSSRRRGAGAGAGAGGGEREIENFSSPPPLGGGEREIKI